MKACQLACGTVKEKGNSAEWRTKPKIQSPPADCRKFAPLSELLPAACCLLLV